MAAPRELARRVLLAGGGSGGHVFPALAVGDELARRGWGVDFAGAAGGMEERLVTERQLPFHPLPARPLVGRGLLGKVAALGTLARSTWAARSKVRSLGVAVTVGTGGYVSAPAVLGASLTGVPTLLVEPNARAGVANRWLSRRATEAAVAWEATAADLRCPAVVTGVPVRSAFAELPEAAVPATGEGTPLRLLVLGGSQGSAQLNRELPAALGLLRDGGHLPDGPLEVLHQAGRGKLDDTFGSYRRAGLTAAGSGAAANDAVAASRLAASSVAGDDRPGGGAPGSDPGSDPGSGGPAPVRVRVVDFIADTAAAVGEAHLVVSRAGALTCAEICAAGRAALLVPLVGAAGGHQVDNARNLEDAGAARSVAGRGDEALAPRLAAALGELLAEPRRLAEMGRAARRLGRPGAAAAIADRVERLADVAGGWAA